MNAQCEGRVLIEHAAVSWVALSFLRAAGPALWLNGKAGTFIVCHITVSVEVPMDAIRDDVPVVMTRGESQNVWPDDK